MSDRRKASHITYATEEESRRALIEICVFLFFLSVTTYIAISLQTIYSFYFNRTLDRLFAKRLVPQMEVDVKFEDIATIEEFWSYLKTTFFENLNTNWQLANDSADLSTRNVQSRKSHEYNKMFFLGQNLILEAPRLRQIRVKSFPCYKHKVFKDLYKLCYGPYTAANELKETEFKGTKFFELKKNAVMPFWGNLERYYGAGYVSFLTYDKVQNENIVNGLMENEWIDRSSRVVMIEMVAYNNNMDLFNNIKFVAEIMPVGGIVSYSHMEVAPLHSVWSVTDPGVLAANVIFYAFIIFNTGNEISEIYHFGFRAYLKSVWNYIDWGIILTAYLALTLSILHGYFIDEYLDDVFGFRYEKLSSIDKTCHWFAIYVASMAYVAFLVWIRIFRFIGFNKTLLAFYTALKQCARDIFGFAIIIFIVFMAFALLGLALFGTSNLDFSTFQYAYFFMMRLMLHDFEYTNFERSNPFWGQLYFMAFIVVVVFLCFNMFLAIISQTYINVKKENIENQSSIRAVFVKLKLRIADCFTFINNKLSAHPRVIPPTEDHQTEVEHKPSEERVHKKIQFLDSIGSDDSIGQPTISSVGTRASRSLPRPIDEDEALKEYFGLKRSAAPLKRSISQYSISTFATPESSYDEEAFGEEEDEDYDQDEKYETDVSDSDAKEEDIDQVNHLEGVRKRVEKLENILADLTKDMNGIIQKLIELERLKKAAHV